MTQAERTHNRRRSLVKGLEQQVQFLDENPAPTHGEGQSRASIQRNKKKSLSKWAGMDTVSWRVDAKKDFDNHVSRVFQKETPWWSAIEQSFMTWFIPALIGILTAASGCFIEYGVDWLSGLRVGYCTTKYVLISQKECGENWVFWSSDPNAAFEPVGFLFYLGISMALATVSACLVYFIAPMAKGSGIPEVKTILGGFVLPEALEAKTLFTKIIGLMLSVSSGLSLGKEGPLVHVACCWANLLSKGHSRYSQNESKRRELISTAAAAGVSVAFGAPLGGVLFSYEEVSTMFPNKTMIRSFFSAVVAALTLLYLNPTGTGKLTMFQVRYDHPPAFWEFFIFIGLGCVGGLVGSLFVRINDRVQLARLPTGAIGSRVHPIYEVMLLAMFTALTNYALPFTRVLSSATINALFHACDHPPVPFAHSHMMDLCDEQMAPNITYEMMGWVLLAGLLRFAQMSLTFGCGVPCGLFVPSLYTGAALGRATGMLVMNLTGLQQDELFPGIYAMVGAAAVLGGVCRVTISLVVIMFELTGGLQLVIPFMFTVLSAKAVGDFFTEGIYDVCILNRGYPFLHEPDDVTFNTRACDIMDTELECITAERQTLGELYEKLSNSKYGGFPLVKSDEDRTLLGYIHTQRMKQELDDMKKSSPFINDQITVGFAKWCPNWDNSKERDLSDYVDGDMIRIVSETPLAQVHNIFRQLGIKLVLVTRFADLEGMITKKSFVDHCREQHMMHLKGDPAIDGHEGEDPAASQGTSMQTPLL